MKNYKGYIFLAVVALALLALSLRQGRDMSASSFLALEEPAAESYIDGYIKKAGARAAWTYLRSVFDYDGAIAGKTDSHELAHIIGKALYTEEGLAGLAACDQSLTMGCFHGFMRGLLNDKGAPGLAEARDLCKATPSEGDCIHGVSHGILGAEKGDVAKSLQDCETYMGDFQAPCWQGVFMEEGIVSGLSELDWKPCLDVPEKYRPMCASGKPGHMLAMFDAKAVADFCATGASKEMREECYYSMGADISHRNKGSKEAIELKCGYIPRGYDRDKCFQGAAQNARSEKGMKTDDEVLALCAMISDPSRVHCID